MRPVAAGDLDRLYRIATDPAVAPMLFLFHPGMARERFAAHFPPGAVQPPFRLSVLCGGDIIGSIGMGGGSLPPVYYFLAPICKGQGLGGEMLAGFLAAVDRHIRPPVVSAEVFSDNPASLALLRRNGFAVTGARMLISAARPSPAAGLALERRA